MKLIYSTFITLIVITISITVIITISIITSISWQIFENKVWCPVSKKRRRYFHFLLSPAYPIDRLDRALFSVVILFHHIGFLYWRNLKFGPLFCLQLPRGFDHFSRRGGEPPPPHSAGRGRESIPGLNVYKSDKTLHCCIKRTFLCSSAYFQQSCFWTHCDYTF